MFFFSPATQLRNTYALPALRYRNHFYFTTAVNRAGFLDTSFLRNFLLNAVRGNISKERFTTLLLYQTVDARRFSVKSSGSRRVGGHTRVKSSNVPRRSSGFTSAKRHVTWIRERAKHPARVSFIAVFKSSRSD